MKRSFARRLVPRNRSAIMLIELLFVIALLGVFAVIASSIFSTTMKVLYRANADDTSKRAMDSALSRLRSDIWNATAIRSEENGLVVDRPDGSVNWSFDDAKQLIRSTGELEARSLQAWPVSNLRVAFDVKGPTVGVEVSAPDSQVIAQERLVSQAMLLSGGGS